MALEHRFYGSSQPCMDWSKDNLDYYLTSRQALADVNYFIEQQNKLLLNTYKDGVTKRKWVVVGGSYPGALVAWFRSQYPESAVAAWSSSGVINAIKEFSAFDGDIFTATSKSGPECPQRIQSIIDYVDQTFLLDPSDAQYQEVMTIFGTDTGCNQGDFMFYLADIFTIGVQYGGRVELCNKMAEIDSMTTSDKLQQIREYADKKRVTMGQYDARSLQSQKVDFVLNIRQWTFQYCTQFAWYQIPNSENAMRSELINIDFWSPYCGRVFDTKDWPDPAVEATNLYYGGTGIKGSHIYFINSSEDPWQFASIIDMSEDQKASMKSDMLTCDNCGHCSDLKTDQSVFPADVQ